jgi:hypothetical protein
MITARQLALKRTANSWSHLDLDGGWFEGIFMDEILESFSTLPP